jgi:hypothetical protein
VIRPGPRTGQRHGPVPRTGAQAHAPPGNELTRLIRAWPANRGIGEAPPGAGPATAVPATSTDVARSVNAHAELPAQLRKPRPAGHRHIQPPATKPPPEPAQITPSGAASAATTATRSTG